MNHSLYFLVAVMLYGRFASKCSCSNLHIDRRVLMRACKQVDLSLVGSSHPFTVATASKWSTQSVQLHSPEKGSGEMSGRVPDIPVAVLPVPESVIVFADYAKCSARGSRRQGEKV